MMTTQLDALLLELFNGSEVILKGIFMLWALRYLWLETRRRGLHFIDWFRFRLPPSMGFIIAVIVSDSSEWLRSAAIWVWRRFYHGGELVPWQIAALLTAGFIGILGGLCKIRSVTKPDYGDEPWLVCLAMVLVFVAISLLSRLAF
jgi:hypothetical protein